MGFRFKFRPLDLGFSHVSLQHMNRDQSSSAKTQKPSVIRHALEHLKYLCAWWMWQRTGALGITRDNPVGCLIVPEKMLGDYLTVGNWFIPWLFSLPRQPAESLSHLLWSEHLRQLQGTGRYHTGPMSATHIWKGIWRSGRIPQSCPNGTGGLYVSNWFQLGSESHFIEVQSPVHLNKVKVMFAELNSSPYALPVSPLSVEIKDLVHKVGIVGSPLHF